MTQFELDKIYTGSGNAFTRTILITNRTAKTVTYNLIRETLDGREVGIDIACEKKARVWVNADGIETFEIGVVEIHA